MILGSVSVRGGSQGVPRKNIRELRGHPLMAYAITCAKLSEGLDAVAVSSDDQEMLDMGRSLGADQVFRRPDELATSTASKWPVLVDLLEQYEAATGEQVDYVVDLDVTVPLRKPHHIDACIAKARETGADVVGTCYESERNPYFNMMEEKAPGKFKVVIESPEPIVRRQDAPMVYSLTPAVYVCSRHALYAYDHWARTDTVLVPMSREEAVDIDSELDFKMVEFLLDQGFVTAVL